MLCATYNGRRPHLPADILSVTISRENPSLPVAATGFACLLKLSSSSSSIVPILQELISLAAEIQSIQTTRPSDHDLMLFTARRSWIEWKLSTLLFSHNSSNTETATTHIENCCRLAAHIYINIVLRLMPPAAAVFTYLADELKDALKQTNLKSLWEGNAELLMWILFQGGAAATDEKTKDWYLSHLVPVFKYLWLQTWAEVYQLLSTFLWVRCSLARRCKPLWSEITVRLSRLEGAE